MITTSKEAYEVLMSHPYFSKFCKWDKESKYNSFPEFQESFDWGIDHTSGLFWVEAGSWSCRTEHHGWYDDIATHFYACTFENCLIKLANFIVSEYGNVVYNSFYEECEPYEVTLGKTTEGKDVTMTIKHRFNERRFKEWRDSVGLETPHDYLEVGDINDGV